VNAKDPRRTDVLIVGAGPTGLAAANVLARNGVGFRIVDSKSGPTEESRALWVQPRTVEYWDKLGLSEEALAEGQTMTDIHLLIGGKPSGKIAFGGQGEERTPYPFGLILEQSKSERLLLRGLERAGGRVEWNTELVALSHDEEAATAVLRRSDGTEEAVEAAWVIGADGARSAVRESLGLKLEGETYDNGFFLADVAMEWDKGHEDLYLNLTDDGFLAFFPMRGEGRFRVIGSLTADLKAKHDAGEKVGLKDIRGIVEEESGVGVRLTGSRWVTTYRIHRRMVDRFREGRVFLAGDAAHIHSPAGGQGMNTGIGDAFNLAWKLAAVVRGAARPILLDSYEAERLPVAREVLSVTDRLFSLEVTDNPFLKRFRTVLMPGLLNLTERSRAVGGLLFGIISQVRVNYRESPVVGGESRGGGGFGRRAPRPGDRAPFGTLEDGTSLYHLLRGTAHHLLFFEGLRADHHRGSGVSRAEIEALLGRYKVPVVVHRVGAGNRKLHELYGAKGPKAFLIRSDGYIAYRGPAGDALGLGRCLENASYAKRSEGVASGAAAPPTEARAGAF